MGELKPCPFCGSLPCEDIQNGYIEKSDGSFFQHVWCDTCNSSSGEFPTAKEAVERWNTRPRTEGRGEGEPVASDKALFDALWELVAAMANEGIPQTPRTKAAFKVAHQAALDRLRKDWSSPIREPEISKASIMAVLDEKIFLRALSKPEMGDGFSEGYGVFGLEEAADAILNLAPVAKGVSHDADLSDEFDRPGRLSDATRHSAEGAADPALSGTRGVVTPVGGRGEEAGWLIERQDLAPYPLYMRHTRRGHSWTPDPNEAARFATKDEASAECCGGDESGPLKVTEHVWQPLPPPPQEQGGMK